MSELLYNKSKAVEELNKVEGFYPLEPVSYTHLTLPTTSRV